MDNLAAVRPYFAAWNARSADAILAALNDSGTYEDPGTGGPISGEALRAHVTGLWSAFPDLRFEERSLAGTGESSAAALWIMRGTNTGSMMGLPPTGKAVELHGADFIALKTGKVETVAGYFDTSAVPRQLGLDVIVQPFAIGPFKFGIAGDARPR